MEWQHIEYRYVCTRYNAHSKHNVGVAFAKRAYILSCSHRMAYKISEMIEVMIADKNRR